MKTKHILSAGLLCLCGFSEHANAGLFDVKDIKVLSTNNTWIQIAEIVAIQTGTGSDVALSSNGGSVSSSPAESGAGALAVIDGIYPSAYPNIYHSTHGGAYLDVSLSAPSELDSITIYGRTDCCGDRDVYDVTLFDQNNVVIFSMTGADANNASHSVTITLPNTVPEPASVALLGLGTLLLAARRRRSA